MQPRPDAGQRAGDGSVCPHGQGCHAIGHGRPHAALQSGGERHRRVALQREMRVVAALGQFDVGDVELVLMLVIAVMPGQRHGADDRRAVPAQFVHAKRQVDVDRQHHLLQRHAGRGRGFDRTTTLDHDLRRVQFAQLQLAVPQRGQLPAHIGIAHFDRQRLALPAQPADAPAGPHRAGDFTRLQGLTGRQIARGTRQHHRQRLLRSTPPPRASAECQQQHEHGPHQPRHAAKGTAPQQAPGLGRRHGRRVQNVNPRRTCNRTFRACTP